MNNRTSTKIFMGGGLKVLLSVSCVALMLLSCAKTDDQGSSSQGKPIRFSVGVVSTKAIVDNAGLRQSGKLHLLGQVKFNYAPQYNNPSPQKRKFLDASFVYNSSEGSWVKEDGSDVYWNDWGTHKFFGWTLETEDTDVRGLIKDYTISAPYSEWVEIGMITFTPDSPQSDFLYSDVVTRTLEEGSSANDYSPVTFTMNHLFSACDVIIKNKSGQPLTIKHVSVSGFQNKNRASIKFDGDQTKVEYGTPTVSGDYFYSDTPNAVMAAGTETAPTLYGVFSGQAGSAAQDYRLIWPQDNASLSFSVEYELNGQTLTKTGSISGQTLSAASGRSYALSITDEVNVPLEVEVSELPWWFDKVSTDLEVAGTGLYISPVDFDVNSSYDVTIRSDETVTGKFAVTKPAGGVWIATLEGDTDYFTLSPSYGTIPDTGTGKVTLSIIPNASLDRTESHSVHINFGILSPNMDVNVKDILNPLDYRIILPYKVK